MFTCNKKQSYILPIDIYIKTGNKRREKYKEQHEKDIHYTFVRISQEN